MNIWPKRIHSGFSLVELAIVLVILGLLVGGILTGQMLIRASELRAITTERERYVSAINAFRDKYLSLPGDLANAYQFWGAPCGTNTYDASTGCNGDGNNIVETTVFTTTHAEGVKAWEHLVLAGIIEGSYNGTGLVVDPDGVYLSTTNTPKSRFDLDHWSLGNAKGEAAGTGLSDTMLYLAFGFVDGTSPVVSISNRLTRSEASGIDQKLDDGNADTGSLRGDLTGDCHDAAGLGIYGADASLGGNPDETDCSLNFVLQ